MAKELAFCDLLDIYAPLLSEKKRRLLELYYYDDLSLSEIVENEGGSRQGALDMIKRASNELLKMEKALNVLELNRKRANLIEDLKIALEQNNKEKATKIASKLEEIN